MLLRKGDRPARSGRRAGTHRHSIRTVAASLALLSLASVDLGRPAAESGLPASIEFQIKASFVYTVAKFVEWPAANFPAPDQPLTFGILGDDSVSDAIAATLQGKRVHDRELIVRHLLSPGDARDCQILYISAANRKALLAVLEQVGSVGILTVGEGRGFAASGGILGLSLRDSLVQFEVNVEAAERAGLTISSKILRLGSVVNAKRSDGGAQP